MKPLRIAFFVASLAATSAYAAPKSPKQPPPPAKPTADQIHQLIARLDDLSKKALNCRQVYNSDIESNKSNFQANLYMAQAKAMSKYGSRAELTALDRAKVELETLEELRKNANFPKCQEEAREEAVRKHAEEIGSLPPTLVPVAKSALAQWLTLIDAVPSKTFEEELSKYRLSINAIRVEAL